MTYRDDKDAAMARADALQRKLDSEEKRADKLENEVESLASRAEAAEKQRERLEKRLAKYEGDGSSDRQSRVVGAIVVALLGLVAIIGLAYLQVSNEPSSTDYSVSVDVPEPAPMQTAEPVLSSNPVGDRQTVAEKRLELVLDLRVVFDSMDHAMRIREWTYPDPEPEHPKLDVTEAVRAAGKVVEEQELDTELGEAAKAYVAYTLALDSALDNDQLPSNGFAEFEERSAALRNSMNVERYLRAAPTDDPMLQTAQAAWLACAELVDAAAAKQPLDDEIQPCQTTADDLAETVRASGDDTYASLAKQLQVVAKCGKELSWADDDHSRLEAYTGLARAVAPSTASFAKLRARK